MAWSVAGEKLVGCRFGYIILNRVNNEVPVEVNLEGFLNIVKWWVKITSIMVNWKFCLGIFVYLVLGI